MENSDSSDLRRFLPCLHILRAGGLAIDPGRMLLGGIALLLLVAGEAALSRLPFSDSAWSAEVRIRHYASFPETASAIGVESRADRGGAFADAALRQLQTGAALLFAPLRSIIEPGLVVFRNGNSWSDLAWAWTRLLWSLAVWSLFGGAICRGAACRFAVKQRVTILQSLKFSCRQFMSYVYAPLIPLAGIGIMLAVYVLLGFLASLMPSVGVFVFGVLWIVVLFFGLLTALLVFGLAIGWPLIISAISTEDSDGFDGLSRAFGFLCDRPWYALLLCVLKIPVFCAAWLLVSVLVLLTLKLAVWSVLTGLNPDSATPLLEGVRTAGIWLPGLDHEILNGTVHGLNSDPVEDVCATTVWITAFWTSIPQLLLVGVGPSFFWSGMTVMYFLLRQSDDGTSLDQVADYREEDQDANNEATEAPSGDRSDASGTADAGASGPAESSSDD